ncbi:MAG TPA: NAD-binding protein, partial [Cellvibrionaceae bacterium]|nr:NAD-binding protein [Cellvibrionaceae bacterium]
PQDYQQVAVDLAAPHIVIAGYGRVGRAVATVLQRQGIAYVAVDMHSEAVAAARRRGEPVILGDARKPELLKKVGIASAQALIITMDNPIAAQQTLLSIRRQWPDLPIFVRSRDAAHSDELLTAGASAVVPETLEVSLQLASVALQSSGLGREAARLCVEELRQNNLAQWQDIERS